MANVFNSRNFNRVILSSVFASFCLTSSAPIYAADYQGANNDQVILSRLDQAVDRLIKLENTGTVDQMIDALLDVKHEIEWSYNINIDMDAYLNHVEQEIQDHIGYGIKKPQKHFDIIRKRIHSREMKHKSHLDYLSSIANDEYASMSIDQELFIHEMSKKKDKEKEKEEEKEVKSVPKQLVFGVSLTLSGVLLYFLVPFPACKPWGQKLMLSGLTTCGTCISKIWDEKEEDNRDKKDKK